MLSDKGRKYMQQMIDMTKDQVDEPILACSPGFTSAGAMASMGVQHDVTAGRNADATIGEEKGRGASLQRRTR